MLSATDVFEDGERAADVLLAAGAEQGVAGEPANTVIESVRHDVHVLQRAQREVGNRILLGCNGKWIV